MRFRALCVMLVVAATSLAGCLGGEGSSAGVPMATDEPSKVVVEAEPGVVVAENRGAVRGVVRTDAELPLPNVRVSVLRTEFFEFTNNQGTFLIKNVTVGEHLLRFEAEGFMAQERAATVNAANVTSVEVIMLPREGTGAGYRPHLHDYWGNKVEHVLYDGPMEFRGTGSGTLTNPNGALDGTYRTNVNATSGKDWEILLPVSEGPIPNIILPGTAKIEITLAWTSSSYTLDRMGLTYEAPNSDEYILSRKTSGESWILPVTPETQDNGHQRLTSWEFWAYAGNDVRQPTTWQPGLLNGPIEVTIKLIRAEVILEPAHEDHWGDQSQLVIRKAAEGHFNNYAFRFLERTNDQLTARDGIVPPGTSRMRMEFSWKYNAGDGTAPSTDWGLTWRTSEMDRESPFSEYKRASPIEEGDQSKVYEIDVQPHETDQFYQHSSSWRWLPSIDGFEDEEYSPDPRQITFYLKLTVYRDATFVGGA